MSFQDDDEPFAPDPVATPPPRSRTRPRRPPPRRPPGAGRSVWIRRLIALGIGIGILFLILILFRACQDARKERGFDNYVRDMTAIANDASQLSSDFFGRLADPSDLTASTLEEEIKADAGTAESLVQRVQGISVPEQLSRAQAEMVLAFQLRRDAISNISDEIAAALSEGGSADSVAAIANDMQMLLAADVIYARARHDIENTMEREGISLDESAGTLPVSNFLPEPAAEWIDKLELGGTLASIAGVTGAAPTGLHGVAILQTNVKSGQSEFLLLPDQTNTIAAGAGLTISVDVQNQGDTRESNLSVSYELTGAGFSSSGETTIAKIEAGGTETATMTVDEQPVAGSTLTLTVTVLPVSGEAIEDNNQSTYTLAFQ